MYQIILNVSWSLAISGFNCTKLSHAEKPLILNFLALIISPHGFILALLVSLAYIISLFDSIFILHSLFLQHTYIILNSHNSPLGLYFSTNAG